MSRIKVAILFGGCSSEYEVSLASATSVIRNIDKSKYEIIMIGITKWGDFYLYNGDIDSIEKDEWYKQEFVKKVTFSTNKSDNGFIIIDTKELINIDIAFPVLHGKNGEDGRLQGLFELAEIKYVGCDMTSSAICMDKYIANELVSFKGINVPKSCLFDNNDSYSYIESKISDLEYPLYIKPLKCGSSFGITKINDKSNLKEALKKAFSYDNEIIVEENIDGFEVECAILGNNELTIGEVDEIELQDGFFNYTEKYTLKTSKIHLPARLDEEEKERIKLTALKIYKILGCKGFARVDLFYTKDKKIVFNEVNTIPSFTSHSRYPSMLTHIGYSFSEIIDKLITLGMER